MAGVAWFDVSLAGMRLQLDHMHLADQGVKSGPAGNASSCHDQHETAYQRPYRKRQLQRLPGEHACYAVRSMSAEHRVPSMAVMRDGRWVFTYCN